MTGKPEEYKEYKVHFTVSFKTWFKVSARSRAEAERETKKAATEYYQRMVKAASVTITKCKK